MARTDIGRAVPLLKGEYSPTTTYELNDIVSLNGSFYWHYSHEQTTNVAPQATSTWKVVINLADAEAYIARAEFAAESAEDAAEIATAAKTAAESASTTATGASATATAAKNDALTAKTAAETAQAGAVTAKTAAETARDAAQASATAAGTSATNAGNSAGTAEYYAGIATTAGETANEKATEATGAATTATSAAATATSAKDTAVSSASTASTAATTATSAATAAQAVKDSIPQDYTSLSEDVDDLKTQITLVEDEVYNASAMTATTTASGWRLNASDGLSSSNANYKMLKYPVTAGDTVKVVSDDRFQFQTVASVPSSGTNNRVGETYGIGTYILIVPDTATYLIVSTPETDSTAVCYFMGSNLDSLKGAIDDVKTQFDYLTDNGIKRVYLAWEPGSIDSQTGGNVPDNSAVRTVNYIAKDDIALWDIQAHSGALYVVRYNYSDGSYTIIGYNQRISTGDFTTWLKSLEGTHFRFEVFTANATPNDWMTTCYITALCTKEDEEKINNKIHDIEGVIGYYENSFNVTAGTNHSSLADILSVDIKTNQKFHVNVSGNVSESQIYAIYSDSTDGRLIIGFAYDGVAAKDIIGIGVFIPGSAIPSDTTVKIVAYTTESIYGKTTKIPDEKTIVTTVLGANLPGDISGYGVSSAYATEMKNAIDAWMGDYAGDTKKIPFIVHTDQHGRLTVTRQGIFNLLDWLVNWEGISVIFNLGDTVVDHWENDNTNTNPLLRNATLEDARICIKNIPDHKQINVYGNHDTWYSGTLETAVPGVLPSLQYNNPYFTSDGLITKMLDDNSGNKVVFDAKNNVKYLVLAGWDYADKPSGTTGYQWYWINKAHLEWIISQMAENDGYDLVLVSHVPLEMCGTGSIDPITDTSIESENPVYITHGTNYLLPLWNARKAKTAGSIVYNGETITFDFTACEKDCLCALAGHTHYDGVEYLGGTGLLQVAFDWFTNDTIHFGIIDRRNNKVKCWKLSNDNNTPSVDAWEKSFSVS